MKVPTILKMKHLRQVASAMEGSMLLPHKPPRYSTLSKVDQVLLVVI